MAEVTCTDCSRVLIKQVDWYRADPKQRAAWSRAGLRMQKGRGLCVNCYTGQRRRNALPQEDGMKRTPEPHGTRAAYMRHRRAGEEACAECKKANARSGFHKVGPVKTEPTEMDRLLEKKPPVIHWEPNGRGVLVAVYIDDPHADGPHNREKAVCKRGHPFDESNTMTTATGRQCRICKNLNRKANAA